MLYDPIRKLNRVHLILQEALAAAHRVAAVMAIRNDVEDRPGARDLDEIRSEIRFDRVSFAYEDDVVLHDVDLTIPRGEAVALVGPSGAGKSTLVNLLPRFFDPDRGVVSIDGVDLREVTLRSLRSQIGIVTQETLLFNDTVRHNIAYGRSDLPFEAVRRAAEAAYAEGFIAELPRGYDTVIGEGGLKLSGGQRQRLAIARALLKDPPILILDEATSHLDSESEALVQKALGNLMAGRTALVIAHRLSTVQRSDRILVMEAGRIVEEGTHRELLAAGGVYQRLYDLQFRDE
jgi:subfamily B ATP-binding cassette protein MsbA